MRFSIARGLSEDAGFALALGGSAFVPIGPSWSALAGLDKERFAGVLGGGIEIACEEAGCPGT